MSWEEIGLHFMFISLISIGLAIHWPGGGYMIFTGSSIVSGVGEAS